MAAPARDNYGNWVESSGTSFSHAFDAGSGSNRYLVVCIQNQSATDNVNAPTFNGVTTTLLYKRQNTQAQTPTWNHYYGLAAPATGSNTLALTTSSSCAPFWCVYALSGAKQTGQPNVTGANAASGSNTSFSVSATTTVSDCLLIGMSSDNNGNMAAGSNTTKRSSWGNGYGLQIFDSNSASNTAGTNTLNITGSNGGKSDFTMIAIEPAVQNLTIVAAQGSFTLSGQNVTFTRGKGFSADTGMFVLTGQTVTLTSSRKITIAQGSYALTGQNITFLLGKGFTADAGFYTLTGYPVNFGGTGAWRWTPRSKTPASWTIRPMT